MKKMISIVDPDKISQDQSMSMKYKQHCLSSSQQCLRLNASFDSKTHKLYPEKQLTYAVEDKTTMGEIRSKWHRDFQFQAQQKFPQDQYVFLYGTEEPVYVPSFPLLDFYTVADVKKLIGVQKLDKNILIRVYYQWLCPYQKDQSSISYQKYEETHLQKIETAFKIIGQNNNNSLYFYVPSQLKTTISELKKEINSVLSKNQTINYDPKFQYQIMVKKDLQSQTNLVKLHEALEKKNIKYHKKQQFLDFTKLDQLKLREICAPGEVVYLKLKYPQKAVFKNSLKLKNDPLINIICYQRQGTIKSNKNKKEKIAKPLIQKIVINRKYSQIRKLKVSTLLHEQRIEDALFTSVHFNGLTIKPMERFQLFDKLVQNSSNNKQLQFITIPENLLYYQEIISLDKNPGYKSMKNVLDLLVQNTEKSNFTPEHKNHCKEIRQRRREKLDKQDADLRDEQFLDPIILYTSPFIYSELNKFLRESSLSLVKTENVVKKSWEYPFCEKLIKSLLKLPNFQGTVYRGSVNFDYNYREGQIVQWNSFVSTSRQKQTAINFLAQNKNLRYLFQIQSYSGKQIDKFSYYVKEKEVLVMPYTKFKILKVEERFEKKNNIQINFTYVKMLQIPIPKRIPGNIVVWIDSNIQQNFTTFTKIIKTNKFQNFDLIQLVSNEHFEIWLNQFKHILSLPEAKVHFISNMNRPPLYKQEGIQTLNIIRSFRPTATVVYYIGDINKTMGFLKAQNKDKDPNLQVINSVVVLNKIFKEVFNK